MKQIVFSILFAALLVACNKDSETSADTSQNTEISADLTQIRIKESPDELLKYVGEIGNDFDTALDSLRKLKGISSEIVIKEPLEVYFDYDNRLFFGIIFGGSGKYSDVLDTNGNYYLRTWYCSDEKDEKKEEEHIFDENNTFTITNGCAKIIYLNRMGNDFDSALDSLLIKYEPLLNTLAKEGHYSGEGYNINQEKINVDFSYDSREFILLTFTDKANNYQILFSQDVIDGKGNYYRLLECED